jgi:hypothetical protein
MGKKRGNLRAAIAFAPPPKKKFLFLGQAEETALLASFARTVDRAGQRRKPRDAGEHVRARKRAKRAGLTTTSTTKTRETNGEEVEKEEKNRRRVLVGFNATVRRLEAQSASPVTPPDTIFLLLVAASAIHTQLSVHLSTLAALSGVKLLFLRCEPSVLGSLLGLRCATVVGLLDGRSSLWSDLIRLLPPSVTGGERERERERESGGEGEGESESESETVLEPAFIERVRRVQHIATAP